MSGSPSADISVHRRVAVLGGLGVYPMIRLSLPGRRMLAYLALKRHPLSRGLAAAELWPEVPDDSGRANLRRALWHLPSGWVASVADDLVLQAECDLENAYSIAERALKGEALTLHEISILSEDVLPGWHDDWAIQAYEAFRLLRVQALEAACRTLQSSGAFALATQAGSAAVAAEPLRESAAEALIEAHLAQRNRYEAVQCFRGLARRLHAELGVEPDTRLAHKVAACGLTIN